MRPVLLTIADISPLTCLAILALVAAGVAVWLGVLRHQKRYTKDHLVTGLAITGMAALFLFVVYRVGEFKINAYGTMLMLGFVAGLLSGIHLGKRRGLAAERVLDLGLLILVAAIIGARLLYVLITKDAGPFIDLNSVMQQGLGGLSFHGGFFGALIVALIYVRIHKLNFWRLADALTPSVAIGYAITRIGCFLNGCCYGKHADALPWKMNFLHSPDGPVYGVHPTQLYAALMGLAMFGILLWLSRGNSLGRAGRLFSVFLVLEGIERFVMEIFRQPDPSYHGGLTGAQMLCIALIALGIAGWFLLPKTPAIEEPAPAAEPRKKAGKRAAGAK